ncbi:hypothetical protein BDR04DRAFT_1121810 [Suillus decipiens]|nr:hypothetical protein BDR04DRAFT_1121810 [Suillus decipiens]
MRKPFKLLIGKWMVMVPVAKTHFLVACLNKFGLETQTYPTLPGHLLYLPSVQDIALHMQSGCDPEFFAASMHAYSSQYWIKGDKVQVISGPMSGSWGLILDINDNDGTALVDLAYVPGSNDTLLNIEDSVSFPIMDLWRYANAEASDHKGKSGIVVETDDDMDMLVILDSVSKTEFTVSSHSIERYIVDQGLSASFSYTAQKLGVLPNNNNTLMRGMIDNCQMVLIWWITSSHNPAALQFTSASGYNVVARDLIKVVWESSYSNITVPINHAARLNEGQKHNPMARFIGKQVVVISKQVNQGPSLMEVDYRMSNSPRARTPPPSPPPDPPAQLQPATNPDVWSNPDSIFGPMALMDVGLVPNTQDMIKTTKSWGLLAKDVPGKTQ